MESSASDCSLFWAISEDDTDGSSDDSDAPLSRISNSEGDIDETAEPTTCEAGDFIAMQSQEGDDSVVVFVGKVLRKKSSKLLVQYLENSSPDFGGCWEFSENEDAPNEPWTVEINRNIVLGNVKWLPCPNQDACCFHMTDAQWDKLQRLLETSSVD